MPMSVSTTSKLTTASSATTTVVPVPTQNLAPGAKGSQVLVLQKALVKLGFMTNAQLQTGPGVYGPRTTAAVKAFQKRNKLAQTGTFGSAARAAMKKALAKPSKPAAPKVTAPAVSLRLGQKGAAVLQLQKALTKVGSMTAAQVATGPGIYGPRTQSAVKSFQAKWHVSASGNYDAATRAALTK